jgi:hypothetical protein
MCKRYASHCVWQGRQNDSNTAHIALYYKPAGPVRAIANVQLLLALSCLVMYGHNPAAACWQTCCSYSIA